jgi:hypothetical protein
MRSVVAKERAPWSYKARLSNKLQESFIRTLLAVEHDHEYQGPDKHCDDRCQEGDEAFLLAGDERAPSATAGRWPADLDLGGVQTQLDALGLGIGEHIRQGPQTQARAVGDRAPPLGQERTYLADRAGDGGAVDAEQQAQHRVRQVVPQMNQGGHQPVDKDNLVAGAGSPGPLPDPTSRNMTAPLDIGLPRHGQLLYQAGQMTPGDPGEQPMRQDRPIDHRDRRLAWPHVMDRCPAAWTHA